jgi:hypothetical protein
MHATSFLREGDVPPPGAQAGRIDLASRIMHRTPADTMVAEFPEWLAVDGFDRRAVNHHLRQYARGDSGRRSGETLAGVRGDVNDSHSAFPGRLSRA